MPFPDNQGTDVLVIGAGQAGLAAAYWLRQLVPDVSVLLLDAGPRVGQPWLDRWDSLALFTPPAYSELPGRAFGPVVGPTPSRIEMADYLRDYADEQGLRIEHDTRVDAVVRNGAGFVAGAGARRFAARHLVIATGPFHDPAVPDAADGLADDVVQLHSYRYRRPGDLPAGDVTVVGAGNSAAQIAHELSGERRVTLITPGRLTFVPARLAGRSTYDWMSLLGVLDADTDTRLVGYLRKRRDAVFGRELRRPVRRGRISLRPHRVVGADGHHLILADGSRCEVHTVVWCTGFHSRYEWLRVPGALDAAGNPRHDHGASPVPGLHWMGLPWLATLSSSIVHGVDADGRRTAERIRDSIAATRREAD